MKTQQIKKRDRKSVFFFMKKVRKHTDKRKKASSGNFGVLVRCVFVAIAGGL